jgi:hypothetical protein
VRDAVGRQGRGVSEPVVAKRMEGRDSHPRPSCFRLSNNLCPVGMTRVPPGELSGKLARFTTNTRASQTIDPYPERCLSRWLLANLDLTTTIKSARLAADSLYSRADGQPSPQATIKRPFRCGPLHQASPQLLSSAGLRGPRDRGFDCQGLAGCEWLGSAYGDQD